MSSKVRSIQRERDKRAAVEAVGDLNVTYGQLLSANQSGALGALLSQRFPGRLMQFVKLGEAVMAELKTLDTGKLKVIEQNGGKLNEAGGYDFPRGKQAVADKEFQELLESKATIKGPRLSDSELEGSSLNAAQVLQLMWLIDQPE